EKGRLETAIRGLAVHPNLYGKYNPVIKSVIAKLRYNGLEISPTKEQKLNKLLFDLIQTWSIEGKYPDDIRAKLLAAKDDIGGVIANPESETLNINIPEDMQDDNDTELEDDADV